MEPLKLLIDGEKRTRKLSSAGRRRCRIVREIFITALCITPVAWCFWAVTNTPPIS